MKKTIKVVKKCDFLKRLNQDVFLAVVSDVIILCENAELNQDATNLRQMYVELYKAASRSRRNSYVETQNDLVAMIKSELRKLSTELHYTDDASEEKACKCFDRHLKSFWGKGKYRLYGAVDKFLESLGDMEFDGAVATRISILRILQSRFLTVESDKLQELDAIKAAKKAATCRSEIQNYIVMLGGKFMSMDAESDSDSSLCDSYNNLLELIRANYLRHYKEETDEDPNSPKPSDEAENVG